MQAAINVFSALLTPVIAVIAVYIAYQQWQTNRRRLELDLYERRLHVYQAVSQFIYKVLTGFSPELQDISDLRRNTFEADFLFGADIRDYVRSLDTHARDLWNGTKCATMEHDPCRKTTITTTLVEGKNRESKWFIQQPEAAYRIFVKYLNVARAHGCFRGISDI